MARVLSLAEGLRDRAYVEVLYASGCRNGEALGLDLGDLDFEAKLLRLRGKTGERLALLGRSAIRALRKYLPWRLGRLSQFHRTGEKALFVTAIGRRLSARHSKTILEDLGRRAGLATRLGPQVLRRTFATHLVNRGADLRSVQRLLGHSRIDETARYVRLGPARLRTEYRWVAPELG
jgi:site-specific recombinase XerD